MKINIFLASFKSVRSKRNLLLIFFLLNVSFGFGHDMNNESVDQYVSEIKALLGHNQILLEESIRLKQRQNYLFGGMLILSIIGVAFIYRSSYFNRRYALERQKNISLNLENPELSIDIIDKLKKEKEARIKLEKNLLELRKKQISNTYFPKSIKNTDVGDYEGNLTIDSPFDNLEDYNHVDPTAHSFLTSDFNVLKMQIEHVHPNFFSILNERSTQKLTPLDLRYCVYIYFQLSTKQIASVLQVEMQSVRMFKYRLKQKFDLSKDDDLESFLQEVML